MRQYLIADDTREPRDRIVGMLRGEGKPQARSAGHNRGRTDRGGEVALLGEQTRGGERCFFLADDHRHDRTLRVGQPGGTGER